MTKQLCKSGKTYVLLALLVLAFTMFCGCQEAANAQPEQTSVQSETSATEIEQKEPDTEGRKQLDKKAEIPNAGLRMQSVSLFKDTYEAFTKNAKPEDFDTYINVLKLLGYQEITPSRTAARDTVRYAVYANDDHVLYVRYFPAVVYSTSMNTKGTLEEQAAAGVTVRNDESPVYPAYLRVTYEKRENAWLPNENVSNFAKVCDTKGYLLSVAPYFDNGDENGLKMFYLLSDGTFLVYDCGGHEEDADYLYTCLRQVADKNGLDDIVISAWVITHCHPDHVCGIVPFFQKYNEKVTVQKMLYNPEMVNRGEALDVFYGIPQDIPQYRLHFGQSFYLADTRVDVLYTPEDYATVSSDLKLGYDANSTDGGNKASLVMRLTFANGQTVLMTGDCHFETWDFLCTTFAEELKSDCLQVAHHGVHHGMTQPAMDFISPDYLVYPCGDTMLERILNGKFPYSGCNRLALYLQEHYGKKGIYVAGGLYPDRSVSRITQFFPLTEDDSSAS